MTRSESLLNKLSRNWELLSRRRCSGTIAIVDLAYSTQFKVSFPTPEIWFQRQYKFLDIVKNAAEQILGKTFIKFAGDGALIFAKENRTAPSKFVKFSEVLGEKISEVNESHYKSKELRILFRCVLDYGPDIYVLPNGDPNGTVIDRAFRIIGYLMPNTVAASSEFYELMKQQKLQNKFVLTGKAYLRGVSDEWHSIYCLATLDGFSTQLNTEQRNREALTSIWEMGPNDKPIWIVSGAIHQPQDAAASSYSMQHGDSNAIIELVQTLSRIYPDRSIRVISSEEYLRQNGPSLNNDLVSVGGPDFNKVSERALSKLPVHFREKPNDKYGDSTLIAEGQKFETGRDKNGVITSDPAVFLKLSRAFASDRYFYLVMGPQTQGTYAAASLFGVSSPHLLANHQFLKGKGLLNTRKPFAIIAVADSVQDYVDPIQLPKATGLEILRFNANGTLVR